MPKCGELYDLFLLYILKKAFKDYFLIIYIHKMRNTPRTENKTYYNIKSVHLNDDNEPITEKYFKTLTECGLYYKCSKRLIGYKIKDVNKKNIGKLKNINLYKCKEPIQYEPRVEKDISRDLIEQVVEEKTD